MTVPTREQMLESLRGGQCQTTFTKKNGESRVMQCTLNFDKIPEDKHPNGNGSFEAKENTEVIRVYDTEKEAWRSFRVDSVTDFFTVAEV